LCYLKIADIKEAKELLTKMASDNSFHHEDAAEILKGLNK
jgi:hypothetical protein